MHDFATVRGLHALSIALTALACARLTSGCHDARERPLPTRVATRLDAGGPGDMHGAGPPSPESRDVSVKDAAPRIRDVQGVTHVSPYAGALVRGLRGVVTCVRADGFFMQDTDPDDDMRTSEALFVATGAQPRCSAGDVVEVTAPVRERRASCHGCAAAGSGVQAHLSVTELEAPRAIRVVSSGHAMPAAVRLGAAGRSPPAAVATDPIGHVLDDPFTPLSPEQGALDFYESLEGMLVELDGARVVGPTLRAAGRSALTLLPALEGHVAERTGAGGVLLSEITLNPGRLLLASTPQVLLPAAAVGDRFDGAVRGVLAYAGGKFEIGSCAALPRLLRSGTARETGSLPASTAADLRVAVLNVHNLAATDDPTRFSTLAELITVHLGSPDLLALLEIQDDNGAQDDTWVGAEQTLARLTTAIRGAGGPAYRTRSIDPRDDADGGEPGANVRPVLLFRGDRGLGFIDRPGADADSANFVVNASGKPQLAFSPGRVTPRSSAFVNTRKPLAAELTFRGHTLFVVLVHLTSKLGDSALFDRMRPSAEASALRREHQARVIAELTGALFAGDAHANVMVLGDFNDFEFSRALSVLRAARFTPAIELLPRSDRYTYVFDGNSQALDHILLSPALLARVRGADVVHRHADFPSRITDHDPILAQLRF